MRIHSIPGGTRSTQACEDVTPALPIEDSASSDKRMKLRYTGTCRLCRTVIPARTEAVYERETKTVRCVTCEPQAHEAVSQEHDGVTEVIDSGVAGSSARREHERRKVRRVERIRTAHPKIGGLILALSDDPQSTRAWERGAVGEERLGVHLNALVSPTLVVLHDRRIPGTKANIDHIAVTRGGIWVIDAKRYKGRPELKVEGGILRPRIEKLFVGRRDCSKLVDGVLKQVDLVHEAVGEDIPVVGSLCFVEADWPLIGGSFTMRGVHVLWPKLLAKTLGARSDGGVDVGVVVEAIAARFPPA